MKTVLVWLAALAPVLLVLLYVLYEERKTQRQHRLHKRALQDYEGLIQRALEQAKNGK